MSEITSVAGGLREQCLQRDNTRTEHRLLLSVVLQWTLARNLVSRKCDTELSDRQNLRLPRSRKVLAYRIAASILVNLGTTADEILN